MALKAVLTKYGMVEGIACADPCITVFKSIPYAAPPVGDLRWKAPQPPKSWEGIYDAARFKAIAAQDRNEHTFYVNEFYRHTEPMSEDCLYLDVWTPAEKAGEKLPVLFFIHGGAFSTGYSYEPYINGVGMARRGCVLVSINYRLGALGYLAHADLSGESSLGCSGNYGTMDQLAALDWVRENIGAFGGDGSNITIFGQSAGAMSVLNLITSPLADGKIAKAIMESGGGYTQKNNQFSLSMYDLKSAELDGKRFLQLLGVESIEAARALPVDQIIEAQHKSEAMGVFFRPIVDGYTQIAECSEIVEKEAYLNIPYIIGCNSNENSSNYSVPEYRVSPAKFEADVRAKYGERADEYLNACRYHEDPEAAASRYPMEDMLAPVSFAWCRRAAESKANLKPSYLYYFDHNLPGGNGDAYHSAELWFVFQSVDCSWRPMTGKDFDLGEKMCSYWCNFAKTGDPNGEGLPRWDAYTAENRGALELNGDHVGMIAEPLSARMQFLVDDIMASHG